MIPIDRDAVFECTANCTEHCDIIWYIDDRSAAPGHHRDALIAKGYAFSFSHPSDSVYASTVSVTASTNVNNTQLYCVAEIDNESVTLSTISNIAVLLVISGNCLNHFKISKSNLHSLILCLLNF